MSSEKRLVAACLQSREAWAIAAPFLAEIQMQPYLQQLLSMAAEFYEKDKKAKSVDREYLYERLKLKFDNEKKAQLYVELALECFSLELSALNVVALVLESKKKEKANALAQTLINESASKSALKEQLSEFEGLLDATTVDEASDEEVLHDVRVLEINKTVLSKEGLIALGTKQLTDMLDGGALRGHHIVVFGRPEVGKTALTLTLMRSLVKQKLRGIYFGNEDPIRSIVERFQGCLTAMPKLDRLRDPEAAEKVLAAQGYDRAHFVSIAPGSLFEIERHVIEHKPTWIVIDQMRNLNTRAENRTNQLEAIASGIRSLAKKHDLLAISVTQAGDSAEGKRVLNMGDVDSSNTGIPAQADLMIGVGMNGEDEQNGIRYLSLPKNKLSGIHKHFPVRLNHLISKVEDA